LIGATRQVNKRHQVSPVTANLNQAQIEQDLMSQTHHKPSLSAPSEPTPIARHNSLVVGLLLICAAVLTPNHSQSLGSQPAGRVNVSVFTKTDRLRSNEIVRRSDPIGELIERLSQPDRPALPAAFLSVTLDDIKSAFLAASQTCDAGAMRTPASNPALWERLHPTRSNDKPASETRFVQMKASAQRISAGRS